MMYALVGLTGTAAHYAVLAGLVELFGFGAPRAALIGAGVGALINYLLNYRLTFASVLAHRLALPRFLAVAGCNAALSAALVRLGELVGLHYLIGQVSATLLALLLGYRLNRQWTFR